MSSKLSVAVIVSLAIGLALLALGCDGGDTSLEQTGEEVSEGIEQTTQELSDQRERFQRQAEEQIEQLEEKVDDLRSRAGEAQADLVDDLGTRLEGARKELRDLRSATDSRWEDLKADFEHTVDKLGNEIDSLGEQVS